MVKGVIVYTPGAGYEWSQGLNRMKSGGWGQLASGEMRITRCIEMRLIVNVVKDEQGWKCNQW